MRHRLLAGVLAGGLAFAAMASTAPPASAADAPQPACDLLNTMKATAATIQQTAQGLLTK